MYRLELSVSEIIESMAQVHKQSIVVGGGGRVVGTASVDGGAVRGEGGPVRPQLVVPLTIQMNPMPDDAMIAVCWLRAWLASDQQASPHQAVCQPIAESMTPGFHVRSLPSGSNEHTVYLRFFLTQAEVEDLEGRRHVANSDIQTLYLGLDAMVAALKNYNSVGPNGPSEQTPWDLSFGIFSEVLPFWTSQVPPIWVAIERSTWVREVLPGLGYDRSRLIEVTFPPQLPDHPNAAAQFDKAKRALDERRYGDCISDCRGLLRMWEKQFGAISKVRVAEIVGTERSWPESDVRRGLLDSLWKQVSTIESTPHHPESDVDSSTFDGRDARLILFLTAALSEYVGRR